MYYKRYHFIFSLFFFFFFNDTATTEIYTLSLHDALPIFGLRRPRQGPRGVRAIHPEEDRSEEHTSELQSLAYLVCRLLLEKKKNTSYPHFKKKQHKTQHNNKTTKNKQ